MKSDASRGPGKPVIGFLAARFDEAYQHGVWKGADAEARRLGASIVFFGGQRIGSPIGDEALDNIAFDLAERIGMAGLVVMSNVIGTFISPEEQLAFLARFRSMPVVTIGLEFPPLPCVSVDASGGMAAAAEHLTTVHGRRRFLFLAGPRGHLESEARRLEFLRALSAAEPAAATAAGPASVELLYGDFTQDEARATVAAFLDAGGAVDAVVAANDLMAFGAMSALAERGIDVPREVSVTGFDDNEDSRFTSPPLTTVRQPIAELGRIAVRRVASALGLIPPDSSDARLSVSFVVRRSCGCLSASGREYRDGAPAGGAAAPPAPDIESLAAAIDAEIRAGRNPAELRGAAFPAETRDAALLAIAEGECRYIEARRMAAERRYAALGEIQSSLVSSFGMEDILRETARSTRELGVSGCRLCLFESKGPSPAWSRLMLASDTEGVRILAPFGLRFRTEELVPGGLPKEWGSYVCEPLRFGRESIGYLLCTADSEDRRIYESLRDQVSSALKGAMLMAAERDRERDLERSVRARTSELSAANALLVDEMARRKSLERELLEIANRLLGRIGQDIHDELCQDIAGLGIMAAVLEGKLRRAGAAAEAEEAAILAREAGRTAARAKDMARGLYPAELEAKGIVPAVSRLVEAARERSSAALRLEVTEGFALRDANKALQLYRIAQEALGNALRHSRAKEIRVGLYMDREYATVEVGDDGVGLPAYGGEEGGMGLHILKYRANVIGGELRIRSNEGGTTVSCRVPRLS